MKRRTLLTTYALAPFASAVVVRKVPAAVGVAAGPRAGYFTNALLHTHEGKTVRFYDDLIKGKIVVINFMYATCVDICPGMTANLARVQKILGERVGRDIFMYSITLEPERDTPEVLKKYAQSYRVKPGWLFLTGERNDIETLRRKLGYVDADPTVDKDKEQHIGIVRFGNEALDRWAACPAMSKPDQIAKSILWMEESKSKQTKS